MTLPARLALIAALLCLRGAPAPSFSGVNGFTDGFVLGGLVNPTSMAFLPDGRMLIGEQKGRLLLLDANQTNAIILTTLTTPVCDESETGLLGIAVDPAFGEAGFIYLYVTKQTSIDPCEPLGRVNEVLRYAMGPGDTIDLNSKTVLLTGVATDTGYHNGGALAIGKDNKLYIGTGDAGTGDFDGGGPGTSENPYAQDLTTLEGKVLRINLDGTIPADNPLVNKPPARPEVFASGFRNAYRMAADRVHGGIFVVDVGEDDFEELDILKKGGNYGWPRTEGKLPLQGKKPGDVAPAFAYSHFDDDSLGWAISGVAISPLTFANYRNRLFFADFGSGAIYTMGLTAGAKGLAGAPLLFASDCGAPVDLQFGPNPPGTPGTSLYYIAFEYGEVRRIAPEVSNATQPLTGKTLTLRSAPVKTISALSNDRVELGSVGDMPTAGGATLRVRGTGFDNTYALPAARWKVAGKLPDGVTGFTYSDPKRLDGPITSASVTLGKRARISGSGDLLGHVIGLTDPSPIHLDLVLGTKKLCLEFGGTVSFHAGKDVKAKNAEAPPVCPP